MHNVTDIESLRRFAESLAKDGREGVKWEIRKLQWIREEESRRHNSSNVPRVILIEAGLRS